MQHQLTRTAFGQILGHPTKPQIRFFFPPGEGEGAGGGSGGGAGGEGGTGGEGAQGGEEDQPLSAADAKALRQQADRMMRDRNSARDQAKAYADLGLTPEEIAQLKAERDQKQGGPTPEQVQKDAQRAAEKAASERFAGVSRTQAVKAQAAVLGFHNPAAALAMLDQTKLADVAVDSDTYEADAKAVEALLTALATAEPYLVKKQEPQIADWRTAGIGGTGSSTRPDPGPGTPRLAAAYAAGPSGKQ